MVSLFNIFDSIFKTKIDELKIASKDDKRIIINVIDKSTTFNYSSNIHLSPENIFQLSDEELGKSIKEHTMSNIKEACKDKPEQMKKFIEIYSPSKISVAGSTVTTQNLMPWLTGEMIVEPLGPMPSGDFIEQLPNAINKITTVDTFEISEKVDIKIEEENKKESS